MKRYDGHLIYAGRDDYGPIEVVQSASERCLHFGTAPKQSAMDLADPLRLTLSYTRALLAPLLFQPSPARILLMGLGGGSLAKFLLHHLPHCRLDVVELRAAVVATARDWFALPTDPRLSISIGDGAEFIRATGPAYDLVLVDAFEPGGLARSTQGTNFFAAIDQRLAPSGLVAMNLWVRDAVDVEDVIDDLQTGLNRPVARLPVVGKDNLIVIAGKTPPARRTARPLNERAQALEGATGVEFPVLLKSLRKHNPGLC